MLLALPARGRGTFSFDELIGRRVQFVDGS